jgi:hypothetical protein
MLRKSCSDSKQSRSLEPALSVNVFIAGTEFSTTDQLWTLRQRICSLFWAEQGFRVKGLNRWRIGC